MLENRTPLLAMAATLRWAAVRDSLRNEDSILSVIAAALLRKRLFRVVRILHKPPMRRNEAEVHSVIDFVWEHRVRYPFFRHLPRPTIERLCRNMGALVCREDHVVYEAGVRARCNSASCLVHVYKKNDFGARVRGVGASYRASASLTFPARLVV